LYSGLFDDDLDAVADRLHEAAAVPPVCPKPADEGDGGQPAGR
jgi:hypothetical protein